MTEISDAIKRHEGCNLCANEAVAAVPAALPPPARWHPPWASPAARLVNFTHPVLFRTSYDEDKHLIV